VRRRSRLRGSARARAFGIDTRFGSNSAQVREGEDLFFGMGDGRQARGFVRDLVLNGLLFVGDASLFVQRLQPNTGRELNGI
jgi:hypothetical protein